jgi:hypothetical protein
MYLDFNKIQQLLCLLVVVCYFFASFAQLSFSPTVWLNTKLLGVVSLSKQK